MMLQKANGDGLQLAVCLHILIGHLSNLVTLPGGNCMYLWQNRNWQWDDTNCKIEMRYVCESRLV